MLSFATGIYLVQLHSGEKTNTSWPGFLSVRRGSIGSIWHVIRSSFNTRMTTKNVTQHERHSAPNIHRFLNDSTEWQVTILVAHRNAAHATVKITKLCRFQCPLLDKQEISRLVYSNHICISKAYGNYIHIHTHIYLYIWDTGCRVADNDCNVSQL